MPFFKGISMKFVPVIIPLLFVAISSAHADSITVKNAWARATAPGQEVGAVYLDIVSSSAAKLVKAESTAATSTEIHSMSMKGDVMEMRKIDSLELAAGKTVSLVPGGNHVMLIGLKKPLKEGDKVTVTLTVEKAPKVQEKVEVSAEVKSMMSGAMHHHHP
jgi:copper(I)-binding protein